MTLPGDVVRKLFESSFDDIARRRRNGTQLRDEAARTAVQWNSVVVPSLTRDAWPVRVAWMRTALRSKCETQEQEQELKITIETSNSPTLSSMSTSNARTSFFSRVKVFSTEQ